MHKLILHQRAGMGGDAAFQEDKNQKVIGDGSAVIQKVTLRLAFLGRCGLVGSWCSLHIN